MATQTPVVKSASQGQDFSIGSGHGEKLVPCSAPTMTVYIRWASHSMESGKQQEIGSGKQIKERKKKRRITILALVPE